MEKPDLNLLLALDVLLAEGSVTRAAERLGLSPSAMSRTFARLRTATGDPLLVRAGRGLVATPYATSLRERVHDLSREVHAVLRPPATTLDLASLEKTFVVRANEAFIAFFAAQLFTAATSQARHVRLRFVPRNDSDASVHREGQVDVEIGVLASSAPEMLSEALFADRYVGVVRNGHALLARGRVTTARYAACQHVTASPHGMAKGPVDDALHVEGLARDIVVTVPGFPDALRIARSTDLVATVPVSSLGHALAPEEAAVAGLQRFELPVPTPAIEIRAIWHPRIDADPAQRWFRGLIVDLCRAAYPATTSTRRR
ncbi:LysR family transcriptional regulator [Bacillus sp. NP157]|nr:LysR family transcriptional regulator [Bacillus sp. NP157]